MIGDTTIESNKVVRKQRLILKSGYYKPCFSRTNNLCCKQVLPAIAFKSNVILKTYYIFHHINCKCSFIICLLECLKCKIQCVGKLETEFNIRLNNHRKDVTRKDSIPASNHFAIEGHNFYKFPKNILIEQLNQTNLETVVKQCIFLNFSPLP